MAEDALDAAVVAQMAMIVPIRPRVVVDLCELHVAPVVALGADEKLASGLSAGPMECSKCFSNLDFELEVDKGWVNLVMGFTQPRAHHTNVHLRSIQTIMVHAAYC